MLDSQPYNLIVLSYHTFSVEPNDYVFNRTYDQFANDLKMKDYDWITIDDAHESIKYACKMCWKFNVRAKIFVPTALVGKPGYCTWEDLKKLSYAHDICNHSHEHVKLTELSGHEAHNNLWQSSELIKDNIGYYPRWFVPPFNQTNKTIERLAADLGMQTIKNRTEIKKDSR